MTIADLLDPAAVTLRVSAPGKRQVLGVVADVAARVLGVDADAVLEGLLEREAAGSTGVGHGVAIPHARVLGVDRVRAIFVRLETPVAFGSVDDKPVDLVVALLAPTDASVQHLRALARVSRLMRQPELREQLRKARSADAVNVLLTHEATSSAA
ncbi:MULTISPECIES: PTS sugar transporter subunit IIA [unclassified Caulobacter]|uniref:PTS sugar transporter subunit IIA n=1 Tax=unclassified Caulobacter TaxID=2648921 RepID=UPI000D36C8BB|nr:MULTISPECIES: PTS sugar transporter subunit IIA [unclassified Caulobacter]PTS89634.1 transcriptional regulator [Caulobacter sp. HMWF009]PTT05881.1 transcriptional regulator [Caulobacter sp. HMWF025]